jgi:hypothetical protein
LSTKFLVVTFANNKPKHCYVTLIFIKVKKTILWLARHAM